MSDFLHVVEAANASETLLLLVGQFNGFTFQKSELFQQTECKCLCVCVCVVSSVQGEIVVVTVLIIITVSATTGGNPEFIGR